MGARVAINQPDQNCDVVVIDVGDFEPAASRPGAVELEPVATTITRDYSNFTDAKACLSVKGDKYRLVTQRRYDGSAATPALSFGSTETYYQVLLKREAAARNVTASDAPSSAPSDTSAFHVNEM